MKRHKPVFAPALVAAALMSGLVSVLSAQQPQQDSVRRGLFAEPEAIERSVLFVDRRHANGELANGFYWDAWNMVPGAGWISGGPGYRRWAKQDSVLVDASAAISSRGYKTAYARFELPRLAHERLALRTQFDWRDFPHMTFFGAGQTASAINKSEYHITSSDLAASATFRPARWAGVTARVGALRQTLPAPDDLLDIDPPDARVMFPTEPALANVEQPAYFTNELSFTADTRDFPRHPTRGGFYHAAATNYHASRDELSFRRYEAEAAHFFPLLRPRMVVAMRGWVVASDASATRMVPFYLLPSLGGHNTLRGYADYRFHDRNMLVVNAESRVAVTMHLDLAAFLDAGNVAPRAVDLNLGKRSYGAGLRIHTTRRVIGRVDLARSAEGWRAVVQLTDPLDLDRGTRRHVAAPFVP